tara:strand:+ start:40 stop:810 length:771 start_codon:yes stop_codon:yes gene_type:complete
MANLDVDKLLKSGAHFGHPSSKWHPNFKPFIADKKNGIHIIDLNHTMKSLFKARDELVKIVKSGGFILFVGTKKQAKDTVQVAADRCGMFYVVERWLGGTLTNFSTIKKSIKRLVMLEKDSSSLFKNLTKKELGQLDREKLKLSDLHRGIKDMSYIPSALFFIDGIHEKIAINEAKVLGIPTFGIIDSNTDPSVVDFPIPANDDSVKTIQLIVNFLSDEIAEVQGKSSVDNDDSKDKDVNKDVNVVDENRKVEIKE